MSNEGKKKTADELASKKIREQALTGKVSGFLSDVSRQVGNQGKRLDKAYANYGLGGVATQTAREVGRGWNELSSAVYGADKAATNKLVQTVGPKLIGPKGMAATGLTKTEAPTLTQAADIVAAQDAEMADVPFGARTPKGGAPLLESPLEQSGFTAQVSGGKERPLTRYEDGKGSFLDRPGVRKGGGTFSAAAGPGSANFTAEEWKGMSTAARSQANVDSYKAQTAAVQASMRKPKEGGSRGGGSVLTEQQSLVERRKLLRGYGIAVSGLKDDLRRGRLSAKKGKVMGAMIADHYDKMLGGDLHRLTQEGISQKGQLMTQQARNQGAVEVAEVQERNAAPELIKPLGFEIAQGGADGESPYVLNRDTGETRTLGQGIIEKHRQDVLAVRGNPEEFAKRKAWFESQYAGETVE